MKRRQCYRYTCDYCNKAGCSGGHIAGHERHCTGNPNRVCRMCAMVGEQQHTMAELFVPIATAVAYFKPTPGELDSIDVSGLRELVKNCPACILAALRQFKSADGDEVVAETTDFNFKQECAAWMKQFHDSCPAKSPEAAYGPFDRDEWLATWRNCLPISPLRVTLLRRHEPEVVELPF